MTWMQWYDSLVKPAWTPAPETISLIWWILYPLIAVTFGFVFVQAARGRIRWRVASPFAMNLAANIAFTPILFGLRNLILASCDVLLVLVTIVWMMRAIWPHARWVALGQLPYLTWVSMATTLQLSITWLNA